jgi:hypothetical protein
MAAELIGAGCGCLAFLMTLAVASYMSWYSTNVDMSGGLSRIDFLT